MMYIAKMTRLAALLLVCFSALASAQSDMQQGSSKMSSEIKLVRDFVGAFNARDLDAIMGFFSDDAVYHNMPGPPVNGSVEIRKLIAGFLSGAQRVDWEILNMAQNGNVVFAERVDRFVMGGKDVALPCNGVFEIRGGRITAWRDYFDMATWTRQTTPPSE